MSAHVVILLVCIFILSEHALVMFGHLGSFFFFLHSFFLVAVYIKPVNSVSTCCLVLNSSSLELTSHALKFILVNCEKCECV